MKSQEDTAAVLVLYRPPETLQSAVAALYPQVKWLILVDNGDNRALRDSFNAAKCHWIQSPQNNLALAQNLGIARARELGAKFVLLMDDDSHPAPEMAEHLREAYREGMGVVGPYLEEPALGREPLYITPRWKIWFRRVGFSSLNGGHNVPQTPTASPPHTCSDQIQLLPNIFYLCASGSLIPISVIDAVGGMDEALGLYFVDTEFCLRARRVGLDVVAVRTARLTHRIGQRSEHSFLGRKISTTNHPAPTRFLMCRNRKALWKRYLTSDPGYVVFDVLRFFSEVLRILLFEHQKREKLTAMARGLLAPSSTPR